MAIELSFVEITLMEPLVVEAMRYVPSALNEIFSTSALAPRFTLPKGVKKISCPTAVVEIAIRQDTMNRREIN